MNLFQLIYFATSPVIICYHFIQRVLQLTLSTLLPRKKLQSDDTVLITGAAGGLGRQIAILVGSKFNGKKLLLWDHNSTGLEELKRELITLCPSVQVWTQVVDLRNKGHIKSACDTATAQYGHISHVVLNAGVLNGKTFVDLSEDEIERTFNVNVLSQIWILKKLLPSMIRKKDGHIVAVASTAGLMPHPHEVDYCASKYAVVGLFESLKLELNAHNVTNVHVTCVCPSWIKTPMVPAEFQPRTVLDSSYVAEQVLRSMLHQESVVIVAPLMDKLMFLLKTLVPTTVWTRIFNLVTDPLRLANYGKTMAARRTVAKTM